uniref:Uncharacterized protein n=1 Tax=Noccaea caerulescens TaxID=107243 RepID=A0A1J3E7D5_NOCCA
MKEEDMKEEVVRLGVELSLCLAKSMFLLCDDIHTMLWFCLKLWRGVIPYRNPVLERLLRVIHFVYTRDIKPKGGVFHDGGKSVQWELIRTSFKDFGHGIVILHRLEKLVRRKGSSFDDRLLSSAIVKYKQQVLKKLQGKLEDVSEANGFARETLESHIFDLWKSLFDEEEEEDKATCKVMRSRILSVGEAAPCDSLCILKRYQTEAECCCCV